MTRYFFCLECGSVVVPDDKGREFGGAAEAHFHAQMIIRKTEAYTQDNDDARWIIRITNAEDDSQIVVLFPTQRIRTGQYARAL